MRLLEETDSVYANTFNPGLGQLLNNTVALKTSVERRMIDITNYGASTAATDNTVTIMAVYNTCQTGDLLFVPKDISKNWNIPDFSSNNNVFFSPSLESQEKFILDKVLFCKKTVFFLG